MNDAKLRQGQPASTGGVSLFCVVCCREVILPPNPERADSVLLTDELDGWTAPPLRCPEHSEPPVSVEETPHP
jgi:hypothetical protein